MIKDTPVLDGKEPTTLASQVQSREAFVVFVRNLVGNLKQSPGDWENQTLPDFLEALAGWVEDMPGFYQSCGRPVPDGPDWKVLAEMMLAARVYE